MIDTSWLGPRIDVRSLLAQQQADFIRLMHQLDTEDWSRPTVCPGWTVQDVAAHLLGDHIGRLSRHRDEFQSLQPQVGESLPVFLNRINDEWVIAARRISPALLVELLSIVGDHIVDFWQTVDMDAIGEAVSWAGPDPAPVWLDMAREFTEHWTHHQQLCEATNRPGLTQPEYLAPVLDTFLRALPHTLRDVTDTEGTTLQFTVTGPAGRTWTCTRTTNRWVLTGDAGPSPDALVELDADTTWRLCSRGITPEQAATHARISGNHRLAETALTIVSIIY